MAVLKHLSLIETYEESIDKKEVPQTEIKVDEKGPEAGEESQFPQSESRILSEDEDRCHY